MYTKYNYNTLPAGLQTRDVSCIHELARGEGNTLTVDDSECSAPRPADNQLCNMVTCPPRWQPEPWTEVGLCGSSLAGRERDSLFRAEPISPW